MDPNSVTEGTTRLLDRQEPQAPFGQDFYEHHGNLAQATSRMPPQANSTNRNLEVNRKPTNWVLPGAVMFSILALMALMIIINLRKRARTATPVPPVVTRPAIPAEPPAVPPVPPPAPPQGLPQGTVIGRQFIYPGAETTMEVTRANEGNVLQLHTADPIEKVADWYTEKFKAKSIFRAPEPTPTVILEVEDTKIIITKQNEETDILLHQGGELP